MQWKKKIQPRRGYKCLEEGWGMDDLGECLILETLSLWTPSPNLSLPHQPHDLINRHHHEKLNHS